MGSDRWRSYQILKNADNILGEGGYGCVYKIKEKKTQQIFAAKFQKLKSEYMNSTEKLSM
jgi:serine/threonine protein kinase